MSLAGRLEDVPLSDVMQFVHLGRRSGTLSVEQGERGAQILFHLGAIVGAHLVPGARIGEYLIEMGVLPVPTRDRALAHQAEEAHDRTLGQVLLDWEAIDLDQVRAAIRLQIERTIYEVVTWSFGTFEFSLDRLDPVDDIAFLPEDLLPTLDLNTQMVLLEAARIFDERSLDEGGLEGASFENRLTGTSAVEPFSTFSQHRSDQAADLFDDTHPGFHFEEDEAALGSDGDEDGEAELLDTADHSVTGRPALLFVSAGGDLLERAREVFETSGEELEPLPHDIAAGEMSSRAIVAFEYVEGVTSLAGLAEICSGNPGLTVICVLEDVARTADAYMAGAAAVVPPEPHAILGCFRSLTKFRRLASPTANPTTPYGFEKLRRVVSELRSGVFSASVALSLMKVISESVERAVLFLVQKDVLVAVGAFGFDGERRPLAQRTRGLRLQLPGGDGLSRAIEAGRATTLGFEEAALPAALARVIGRPVHEEIVIFPVLGTDRVILVVYTDNGTVDRPIEEVDILDLAAAEVGIAFENEVLRRQLSEGSGSRDLSALTEP
ncbi:MAG: DUF4388 domain-containing protein [Thermoanaerobaculia bacterium]|nr:DUF4388 domain-containing protein [Thermoanaerobaculia bacterium]